MLEEKQKPNRFQDAYFLLKITIDYYLENVIQKSYECSVCNLW